MDTRLFRYLFENTSSAIVMTGCTWDKEVQEQTRYVYSCEMSHINWKINRRSRVRQMVFSSNPINLFVMGTFSIEDAQRFIHAIRNAGVVTAVIPYVPPVHRFLILQSMEARGIDAPDIIEFIRAPYLFLKNSTVKRFYFIYGNGSTFRKTDAELFSGYHFEMQDEKILNIIEEMEGYRIPVMKAGHIVDNRMLFYFGCYGADLQAVRHFILTYSKSAHVDRFGKREMQKMLLHYLKEFGDPCMDSLTMFCSPIEIIVSQTDCVFNVIVIDKEDFCHADIEGDEGRCSLKCMLYNDYDVCHCHRTEEAELRAGALLLGNIKLSRHLAELKRRYQIIEEQIRAVSLPNCGNISNWESGLAELNAKKNAVFWVSPIQAQTSDRVLREIKAKNARYRIIGLNEGYGCCFNGFLTEKTI